MADRYRKRFVLINMFFIGAVLLVVYGTVVISNVHGGRLSLRIMMQQVLEPLDEPNAKFQKLEQVQASQEDGTQETSATNRETPPPQPTGPKPNNADGTPPERPAGNAGPQKNNNEEKPKDPKDFRQLLTGVDRSQITTVFYDDETQEISVSKTQTQLDSTVIAAAMDALLTKEDGFGKLKEQRLYYYLIHENGHRKAALLDELYYTNRTLSMVVLFTLVFLAALGVFLIISIRLSRLAAKPMEEAMQLQRQFVDDVSHDLKTPITVILANNSIIKGNADETVASQMQWLDSTDDAAKNMMHMINEMLSLSLLESPQASVETVSVDLTAVAEKATLQMESLAFDRGIVIEEEIDENVTVLATAEYAERICNSLLENALKYEPDGGRVRVKLHTAKKQAVLTVQNFGAVISKEDLPHIFERFYRSDKSRASADGHGLGLPILQQICRFIGAQITAESDEKQGTVFRVRFSLGSSAAKKAEE